MTATIGVGAGVWFGLLSIASWSAFLLFRQLFSSWPDQGFGLSKVTGPLVVALAAWVLAQWTSVPWSGVAAAAGCALLVAAAAVAVIRGRPGAMPWRRIATIEALWIAAIVGFAAYRSLAPTLFGGERFMDHALLASIVRSEVLPPLDPWLAGHAINYHYVGHAMWAALAKLAPVSTTVSYNFILATLPAQVMAALCSLGGAMVPRFWWASAAMAVCAGPLTTLGLLVGRAGAHPSSEASMHLIPGTITDYPVRALTNGELHAHVIAMPVFVVFAALIHRVVEDSGGVAARRAPRPALLFLVPVCAAVLVLTSSWEVASAAIGVALAALCLRTIERPGVAALSLALVVAALVAWPFFASVSIPRLPAGLFGGGTPLARFVLVTGLWLGPVVLWAARSYRWPWWGVLVAPLVLVSWLWPAGAVRVGVGVLALAVWRHRAEVAPTAWRVACWALALLFLAESVWIDDVYGPGFGRLNVVFKWHLQAMMLCAIAAPSFVSALVSLARVRDWPRSHLAVAVFLAGVMLLQPVANVAARVRGRADALTLDSLDLVRARYPGDAAVIDYLVANAPPGAVVLEAAGTQYTYASRISSLSGQPTLLGWAVHEELWRRGAPWPAVLRERGALVESFYKGPDADLADRLRQARVAYIVVGVVERRRYPQVSERRFANCADVVVRSGDTVLMRVR